MQSSPTIAQIQSAVCARFKVHPRTMRSADRHREYARPRQIAMYLAKSMGARSWGQVGRQFDRHHTTALHASRKIEALRPVDAGLDADVRALATELSGPGLQGEGAGA